MIDAVIGIKVRMSGLCINRYRLIIGRLLVPYRCIFIFLHKLLSKLMCKKSF